MGGWSLVLSNLFWLIGIFYIYKLCYHESTDDNRLLQMTKYVFDTMDALLPSDTNQTSNFYNQYNMDMSLIFYEHNNPVNWQVLL